MFMPEMPVNRPVEDTDILIQFKDYFEGLCKDLSSMTVKCGDVQVSTRFDRRLMKNIIRVVVSLACSEKIFNTAKVDIERKLNDRAAVLQEAIPHCKIVVEVLRTYNINKEGSVMFIPEVVEIIHRKSDRGEFFTVCWADGTNTTVRLMEGDTSDEYTAMCFALGKKLFENRGVAREFITEKKAVFEERVEAKAKEKERQRKIKAIQQSVDAETMSGLDFAQSVYENGFIPTALISRTMFKKNGR